MGCFFIELNRLGNTPTPTIERVGATPTAELDYLGGVPIASLVGLSDVPTAVLEHLGGMVVSGSLLCYVGNDTLTISETSLSFTNADVGTPKSITVLATSKWSVELIDPDGLFKLSTTAGVGGIAGRVAITLTSENPYIENYSASVVFKSRGLRQTLTLVAEASEATYTRLTYIECNGQQYIDLGYVVKEDDVIEANIILTKVASADHFLFGTVDDNNGLWYELYSNTAYARFGETSSTSVSSSAYKYSIKLKKGSVQIGTGTTSLTYNAMPTTPINLFAGRSIAGGAYAYGYYRCTKFRITDNNGLVMDLVPAKRDSDGVVGMLDLVSGTFYTSAEEPFIAGNEMKVTTGYELLEYTTFNADNLYDLGIVKSTYELEVLFQRSETKATPYLYGCVTSPHTASVSAYLSSGGAWRWGTAYKGIGTSNLDEWRVRMKNGNALYNGTSSNFTKSTFTTPDTVVLGGYRTASGSLVKGYQGKVFYIRIHESGDYVLDWYPCKRLSDGVEGFWDCVSQTFIEPIS